MQEEITQGAVSLSVEAGKMTADLLQKALKKVLEEMQKKPSQRTLRQGKQTLHQLKQHGASLTNIEITEQNIKAFSAVAKKYDIDYALKKDPHTEPPHYYVFFKAKDKDQLQPAFKEFTAMTTRSAASIRSFPSCSTITSSARISLQVVFTRTWISSCAIAICVPIFRNCPSSPKTESFISTTVTLEPFPARNSATSMPTSPPPITTALPADTSFWARSL